LAGILYNDLDPLPFTNNNFLLIKEAITLYFTLAASAPVKYKGERVKDNPIYLNTLSSIRGVSIP
jgi:hypothetical protein